MPMKTISIDPVQSKYKMKLFSTKSRYKFQ